MKQLILLILLALLSGCTDPFFQHNQDVINTVKKAKQIKSTYDSDDYMQEIRKAQ